MITTDLTTLKINKLTKAQYEAALAAGNINENELYMTPESETTGGASSFVAEYNVTSYKDIEDAYNAGNIITAVYNGLIYQLYSANIPNSFMFVSVPKNNDYVQYIECEFTGDWYTHVGKRFLPDAGTANNGKVLMVVNGAWATTAITKPTSTVTTLTASNWDSTAKTYSFESTYPSATYDLEIALDSTATAEQAEAFNGAQIVGSATSNVVKAYGIVPTVDIPVILKVVRK